MFSAQEFLERSEGLGYKVFDETIEGGFNLNIVGWRNSLARVNYFDDFIAVYWKHFGKWEERIYPATTRPGLPSLLRPINPNGTAILVSGQYLNAFKLGEYKGYLALRQYGDFQVWRDVNRDQRWDFGPTEKGNFGIHLHRASLMDRIVGTSSAGCQVVQKREDYRQLINLCQLAATDFGNTFTYTLLDF